MQVVMNTKNPVTGEKGFWVDEEWYERYLTYWARTRELEQLCKDLWECEHPIDCAGDRCPYWEEEDNGFARCRLNLYDRMKAAGLIGEKNERDRDI